MKHSILIISWFFYPKIGGVETVALDQAKYLEKKGWQVTVLTSKTEGSPDNENLNGIKIYRRNFLKSSSEVEYNIAEAELEKVLFTERPGIVYFHNGSYIPASSNINAGVANALNIFEIIKKHNLPIIDCAHNAQLKEPELMKKLRDLAWDYLICVSKFTLERYKKLGFGARKCRVINNGIDLSSFINTKKSPLISKTDDIINILFPSRVIEISRPEISKQKNLLLVLRACQKILEEKISNFNLVIVLNKEILDQKNSESSKKIQALIDEHNLSRNVLLVPAILRKKINEYYQAVDVVCVPSFNENYSMTYLETMAAGKIPIGSSTGGTPEIIKDNYNGFLVDPNDAFGLSQTLKTIISDKNLRDRITHNAKKSALTHSLEKSMKRLIEVFESLSS